MHRFPFLFLFIVAAFLVSPTVYAATVVINEFQASNGETIADEDGDFEDWIELYNYGEAPVLLGGYGLSDDEDNPFRWVLPDIALGPGEFLLVFASNKDRLDGPFLHTNFAISSEGEEVLLTAPGGALIDFVPPTPIPRDLSFGRKPDGTGDWFFFEDPTPGTENTSEAYLGILDPPAFSHAPGFYSELFALHASHSDSHVEIRYSLDGSIPGTTSPLFNDPLWIADRSDEWDTIKDMPTTTDRWWLPVVEPLFKGTTVRLQAHRPGWIPSRPVTHTFFVTSAGGDRYPLPVFSIVTEQQNFFDPETGIYVLGTNYDGVSTGTANFSQSGPEWERPVHIEFFESDGSFRFAQDIGVRIHGRTTRVFPQKSLRLYPRNAYGDDNRLPYPLFPGVTSVSGAEIDSYRRVILRHSGNDFILTMFRDAFLQSLMEGMERVETQAYRPVIVFLNGAFWGLHNLRERYDEYYLASRYELEPERIAILENNARVDAGSPENRDAYLALRAYAVHEDLSNPVHYAAVESQLDPGSLIDHFIANIYFHNTDWPSNNILYWRYQSEGEEHDADHWWRDGRWRWMTFDTDFGFGLRGPVRNDDTRDFIAEFEAAHGMLLGPSANTLKWVTSEINGRVMQSWPNDLFRALMENPAFREQFIRRFADLLNTWFREEYVSEQLELFRSRIEPVMPEHLARWQGIPSMEQWDANVSVMRTFGEQRPAYMRKHIIDEFDLDGTYELRIQMPPEGSARVRVNSIELEADGGEWTGIYFLGVPIEVEIIPELGHEFVDWEGSFEGEGRQLDLNPDSDKTLTPILQEGSVTLHEVILPRFMQGESPDNNDRVPFSCRLRIEGLQPNAVYRYANRVLSPDDPPTQNGAGNAIYYDFATESHFRTTDTPDFSDASTHGEFVTDDNGSYEGWFTLEPTGNSRFGEPELFIRILLNDGQGGEEYRHFLTTENTVAVLTFGFGWGEATGLYATSPLTPGEVVVMHDDPDGKGRPLTATLVENAGFEADERYAAFYEQFVTGLDGHFGTLLPNLLPGGLRRIEAFNWFAAESTAIYTSQDGFWPDNADTVNPEGGLGFPFVLTLGEPGADRVPGDVNGDGVVNAVDVQLVINAALGIPIDPAYQPDINGDGVVNAVDVQLAISAALGSASSPID